MLRDNGFDLFLWKWFIQINFQYESIFAFRKVATQIECFLLALSFWMTADMIWIM